MSSSVFSESPLSTNESRMSNSNLVVVYGKNGVNNVDREGLENLIDDKGISTISVVRLTSPTPSMKDEEETENELKKNKNKDNEDNEENHNEKRNDDNNDDDDDDNESEHLEETSNSESEENSKHGTDNESLKTGKKTKKKQLKEKPESVGLIIEEFCLPEKTKEITKAALTLSGLQPLTVSVDFEIQIKALQNDHCYTPLTSPSQLHDKKPEPKPIPPSAISAATLAKAAQKMAAIKAKNAAIRAASVSGKSIEDDSVIRKPTDESEDNETAEDENESEYTDSEESADTDNDRDSDLDFNLNDRTGRRRKSNKKFPKRKLKNKILKKRQSINSDFNPVQEEEKGTSLTAKIIRSGVDKPLQPAPASLSGNMYKTIPVKHNSVQSTAKLLITSPKPEIRLQNLSQLPLNSQQNVKSPQISVAGQQNLQSDILSNIITGTGKPSGDPNGKPVVQNVVIIKPPNKKPLNNSSGGFTDITKYLTKSDNIRTSNVQVCELIKPDISGAIILRRQQQETKSPHVVNITPTISSPNRVARKGFMPLIPDKTKTQQLPAQISIQIQQKMVPSDESVQKEYDNQEEIDIIDSLVGQIENSEQAKANINTQKTIKMYERSNITNENLFENQQVSQKKPILIHSNNSHSTFTTATNQVDPVDISNAPLLETPDEIPEDLIKDMAELIDHKTLQELVEEQQQQQQQQLQNQHLDRSLNVTDFEANIPKNFLMQQVQQPQVSNESQSTNILVKQQDVVVTNNVNQVNINQSDYESNESLVDKSHDSLLKESQITPVQQPVQVVSRSGRVIILPPIEAPTTRAKRRAAAGVITADTPTPPMSSNVSEASESEFAVIPKSISQLTKQQQPKNSNSRRSSKDQQKKTITDSSNKTKRNSITAPTTTEENSQSQNESSQEEDEDDPNKLWCICRQPHNNRFMICCDSCEDWFHGTCVGVTKSMGKEMEINKTEWTCPNCRDGKKQQTIKQMFEKQSSEVENSFDKVIIKSAIQEKKEKDQNSIKKTIKRKSTDVPHMPLVSTPLSKSMQQKISEIIGVPLPEPVSSPIVIEKPAVQTPNIAIQKKKNTTNKALKTPTVPKIKPEKNLSSNKKKIVPKSKESEPEVIKLGERDVKDPDKQKAFEVEAIPCIVCKKEQARPNSIYCSDDCIRKHAHNALVFKASKTQVVTAVMSSPSIVPDGLEKKKKQPSSFEEALANASIPTPKKIERVCVFERKTGKILTGNNAPTTTNLKRWLQENPTFEVVLPGSPQAQAVERNKLKQKAQTVVMSPEAQQQQPQQQQPQPQQQQQQPQQQQQQRPIQSYRPQAPRPQSQQKNVIKIIKSISSNPSPKPENLLQDINEIIHKPQAQKTLTFHQLSPSKGEKSEMKIENRSESLDSKSEKSDKTKSDRSEKIDKAEKRTDKSPTKAPLKKQLSREKERDRDSDKDRSQSSEPIRLNVKRTLKEKLMTRITEITEENHPKLSESECENFANETEEEMFELFYRDTGVKYKAKYRTLLFNIKDHKNKTLFRKICEKIIEPKQLVRMSPEELASQELAQWRENENKHQLEMIKKSELDLLSCSKNYVLKTHKGEEVIEDKLTDRVNLDITIPVEDVVAVLNNSTVSSTSEIGKTTPNRESFKSFSQENDADSSLGSNIIKNENILLEFNQSASEVDEDKKKEKKEKHYRSKDRHREKSSKRSRSRSRSKDRKRHKTPQKDEDNRLHHRSDEKHRRSQSPQHELGEFKNKKEIHESHGESDKNHHRHTVQHEQEEELHGFDEPEHKHKYKHQLSSKDGSDKRKKDMDRSETVEDYKEVDHGTDHQQNEKKSAKSQHSHHRDDDRNTHNDHKRRSYTHSPSVEDDDEKRKRRHHSSHHYHHRSSSLVSGSSPSIDSEESRNLISKSKTDSTPSIPTSTTVSDVLGSFKKTNMKTISAESNKPSLSNKIHKTKVINQKLKAKDLSEYSLIDKIFAESEKTIEEAANLVPVIVVKERSSIKPADSQSSVTKSSLENTISLTETKDLRKTDLSGNDSEQELPSSTVTIPTPPEDPYIHYASDLSTVVWTGNINMIDVATFNIIIQPISGNCINIEKEFPLELDVVGRIGPDTVWDYISKIKKSPNKEIVLIRLVPSPHSETNAYTALYTYLEKRKRLGVVKSTSPGIKDFYVLPLHSKSELPTILQTVSTSEFIDDDSRPDLLIGIVIRIMDFGHSKRHNVANTTASSTILSDAVTKIIRKPMTSTISSSTLRGETTVIQNKKILGLGDSLDLVEDEDYKPESPHMNISGTKVFSILTGKAVDKIREMKALKLGQLSSNQEMYIGDDADEPYSPGGSSDDDINPLNAVKADITASIKISNTATMSASAEELQRKVEELTRQIEKEKKEIETMGTVSLPATTAELAPSLANISIPSNLQQILASIQKPDIKINTKTTDQLSEDSSNRKGSSVMDLEEYNPENTFYEGKTTELESTQQTENTITTMQKPSSGGSRLASLSEAELLKMVPDNIDLTDSNSNSRISSDRQNSPPPSKKSRWDIDPPPPGLEDEYE